LLHQNGVNQRAPRIEGEPIVPKEIIPDGAHATAVVLHQFGRDVRAARAN